MDLLHERNVFRGVHRDGNEERNGGSEAFPQSRPDLRGFGDIDASGFTSKREMGGIDGGFECRAQQIEAGPDVSDDLGGREKIAVLRAGIASMATIGRRAPVFQMPGSYSKCS